MNCHITADNDHPCLRCGAPFTSLAKLYERVQQRTPMPHLYDHEGTWRHHHDDQTGNAVWWLNVTVYGGEKRPHRHVPTYWDQDAEWSAEVAILRAVESLHRERWPNEGPTYDPAKDPECRPIIEQAVRAALASHDPAKAIGK